MSNCSEPEWDVDDESVPGEVNWWSRKSDGGYYIATLPVNPPPNLFGLQDFALSVLKPIADQATEEGNTRAIIVGTNEVILPARLPELAKVAVALLRHVDALIDSNASEPDYEAGYLTGRMEALAAKRFAEMGRQLSESGKTRWSAVNETRAKIGERRRRETEARITSLMTSQGLSRGAAIKKIAKEEGKSVRSIQKRVELKKTTNQQAC